MTAVNALRHAQLGRSRCSQSPHPAAVMLSLPQSAYRQLPAQSIRVSRESSVVGGSKDEAGGCEGGVQSEVERGAL